MKKVLSLFQVIVITIVIIFAFVGISISQMDDPNRDRSYILDGFTPSPKMYTIDAPVTVNDFDNFYLGVDFAEGNIAQNPINPMWSFAPFNTNGTHYTINGFDWLINNPGFPGGVAGDPVVTYD